MQPSLVEEVPPTRQDQQTDKSTQVRPSQDSFATDWVAAQSVTIQISAVKETSWPENQLEDISVSTLPQQEDPPKCLSLSNNDTIGLSQLTLLVSMVSESRLVQ